MAICRIHPPFESCLFLGLWISSHSQEVEFAASLRLIYSKRFFVKVCSSCGYGNSLSLTCSDNCIRDDSFG
jgi:translation initiation factor 2 gamma subunit (eIF-2gamma)